MVSKQFTLNHQLLLNVKTVNQLSSMVNQYSSQIFIEYNGNCASIKSVMEVALMEIPHKADLTIKTQGKDAFKALFEIGGLLEKGVL